MTDASNGLVGIEVAGRHVYARAYSYIEGLNILVGVRPLVVALIEAFDAADGQPTEMQLRAAFAKQAFLVQWLVAQSITPPNMNPTAPAEFVLQIARNAEWIFSLTEGDGTRLLNHWWSATKGYFLERMDELRSGAVGALP